MVVFLDLEEDVDASNELYDSGYETGLSLGSSLPRKPTWKPAQIIPASSSPSRESSEDDRPNPNLNGFSAALSCYPIVSQLAGSLDLNTVDNLSRTCRQFRANLLAYRPQLMQQTLHCSREGDEMALRLAARLREMHTTWQNSSDAGQGPRITSGKVGRCARDMVGECRRCGKVVCRNCIAKPPPAAYLTGRQRRVCKTCIAAPLALHLERTVSQERLTPPASPTQLHRHSTPEKLRDSQAFTAPAFARLPCSCKEEFWICAPCGQALRTIDTSYARAWQWRTKYCTYLGGLGTGIGEGNEGVECGRGALCLAAKVVEQELDCNAEVLAAIETEASKVKNDGTGRTWKGTSFMIQEMEGIGGVVKKKVKKMVRVGRYVEELKDERERESDYLGVSPTNTLDREFQGKVRSWCAWCDRVIPSNADLIDLQEGTDG